MQLNTVQGNPALDAIFSIIPLCKRVDADVDCNLNSSNEISRCLGHAVTVSLCFSPVCPSLSMFVPRTVVKFKHYYTSKIR